MANFFFDWGIKWWTKHRPFGKTLHANVMPLSFQYAERVNCKNMKIQVSDFSREYVVKSMSWRDANRKFTRFNLSTCYRLISNRRQAMNALWLGEFATMRFIFIAFRDGWKHVRSARWIIENGSSRNTVDKCQENSSVLTAVSFIST